MTERPPNEVSAALRHDLLSYGSPEESADLIDRLTRELSEARAALVKAERQLVITAAEHEGDLAATFAAVEKMKAAEAACRSHAEAIGVLRAALRDLKVVAADNLPSVVARRSARMQDALQKAIKKAAEVMRAPVPALAAQVERERRAEREVVGLAKEWAKTYNWASACDCAACKLCEALAALPASPPGVIDKAERDVTG